YVPEELMRNVYLVPFHAAEEAGAASFMSAYMDLNDVPASGNHWLLTDVLRSEWGFQGIVLSDAFAVKSLETVRFEALDRKCVREHNAFEAPLAAQNVGEEPMISAGWHIVQIHVSAHKAAGACLLCRVEGDQIDIAHQLFRHIRGVVVPPTVRGAVARKMLDAGQDAVRSDLGTLKSMYLRSSHGGAQVRILAGAFRNAAPACVARNIHHRCKGPLNACRARILSCPVLGLP